MRYRGPQPPPRFTLAAGAFGLGAICTTDKRSWQSVDNKVDLSHRSHTPTFSPIQPMTHSDHQHPDDHHHGHHHTSKRRPLHKDWRAWLVVGLMLAAMAMYVLSVDESIQPGDPQAGERMPAAAP
jgi:ABC-type nickel/cobalt efflux system permease component RcnA